MHTQHIGKKRKHHPDTGTLNPLSTPPSIMLFRMKYGVQDFHGLLLQQGLYSMLRHQEISPFISIAKILLFQFFFPTTSDYCTQSSKFLPTIQVPLPLPCKSCINALAQTSKPQPSPPPPPPLLSRPTKAKANVSGVAFLSFLVSMTLSI